jgi:threonine dehydrogenase-like Zn-dependent dehydrogenase
MRVQRLVFTAPGVCEVEEAALPETPPAHMVLVRNRVGLISPGTELAIFTGTHRGFDVPEHWASYPWWPGYANVGEVLAVGEGVDGFAPGDRVLHEGTHATFALQHAATVRKAPATITDERAVFFKLAGIALTPQLVAPLAADDRVVVVGLGMVGNLAAQLCRAAGASSVHAADRAAGRLAVAAHCGLDAWDVSARPLASYIDDALDRAPSYVIEAVGLGATVLDAIRATSRGGRTIILSSPRETVEIDPYFDIHHPARQVIGAHESARSQEERRPHDARLLELLATEQVRVAPFVTHHVGFGADVQLAYEGLRDDPDHWMGVVIEYGGETNS